MQIYLVGEAVRDELLGIEVGDRDFCVTGATTENMLSQGYSCVGKDFPVFLHPKTHEEYALARTERKNGHGYTGFICDFSPTTMIFFFFITCFIINEPIPPIFILDRVSFSTPFGIIIPNILSIIDFLTFGEFDFLKIFKPQKVKNIVTSFPLAFAPFAIINAAIALSKSFENTTRV